MIGLKLQSHALRRGQKGSVLRNVIFCEFVIFEEKVCLILKVLQKGDLIFNMKLNYYSTFSRFVECHEKAWNFVIIMLWVWHNSIQIIWLLLKRSLSVLLKTKRVALGRNLFHWIPDLANTNIWFGKICLIHLIN